MYGPYRRAIIYNIFIRTKCRTLRRVIRGENTEITHTKKQTVTDSKNIEKLQCGPMPNVMVALPNIGGALCSTPQSLADAHY